MKRDMNCCSPSMNWALPCSSSFCKPGWLKAYFLRLKWLSSLKKKEKKGSMLFIFNTEAILSAWNGFWSGHRKAPQREREKLPVVIIFIFACYPLVILTERRWRTFHTITITSPNTGYVQVSVSILFQTDNIWIVDFTWLVIGQSQTKCCTFKHLFIDHYFCRRVVVVE